MTETIRLASHADAEDILAIYAPVVRDTPISFELEPPTLAEMRQRIVDTLATLPWLVAERDQGVVAYAYASPHRSRMAYQWSIDVSVYVAPQARRQGTARRLYQALLEIVRAQGYYTAFAGIALPNDASVGLHEAMGFHAIGVYRNVGYKLGKWRDVGWWALALRAYEEAPAPPIPMADLGESAVLDRGVAVRS